MSNNKEKRTSSVVGELVWITLRIWLYTIIGKIILRVNISTLPVGNVLLDFSKVWIMMWYKMRENWTDPTSYANEYNIASGKLRFQNNHPLRDENLESREILK